MYFMKTLSNYLVLTLVILLPLSNGISQNNIENITWKIQNIDSKNILTNNFSIKINTLPFINKKIKLSSNSKELSSKIKIIASEVLNES